MSRRKCLPAIGVIIFSMLILSCDSGKSGVAPLAGQGTVGPGAPAEKPWMTGAEKGLRPTLIVAPFATDSDDRLPWGFMFGRVLAQKINFAPNELFSIPPNEFVFNQYRHLHRLPTNTSDTIAIPAEDVVKLARILDVDHTVSGKLEKRGDSLKISVEIHDANASKVVKSFTLQGTAESVPQLLSDCCIQIAEALNVPLDGTVRQTLARPTPANGAIFRDATSLMSNVPTSASLAAAAWRAIADKDPAFYFPRAFEIRNIARFAPLEAIDKARKLHEADPAHGLSWLLYMEILDDQSRYVEVINEGKKFFAQNPNCVNGLRWVGRAYRMQKVHSESVALADRFVELQPNSWHAHYMRGLACDAYGWAKRGGDFWANVSEEGKVVFEQMSQECMKSYKRALEINPNATEVLCELADAYNPLGAPDQAIETLCRQALQIEPDCEAAYRALIFHYRPGYANRVDKVMAICREAAQKHPGNPRMQWLMADFLFWYMRWQYNNEHKGFPEILSNPQFTQAMEESINRTLALRPNEPEWNALAGQYYYRKNDNTSAWKHFSRVQNYIPHQFQGSPGSLHEWWREVAWTAMTQDQWEQAIALGQRGLDAGACNSCRHTLLLAMARGHHHRKEVPQALGLYEQAIVLGGPFTGWATACYADLIFEERPQQFQAGVAAAKKAVETSPKDLMANYVMAKYCSKSGDKAGALNYVRQALQIKPDYKEAIKLQAQLTQSR